MQYFKGRGGIPCSGYEGFTCKKFIPVGHELKRCRDCAKKAAFLDSLGDVHNPFSVHRKDCLGQEHPGSANDRKEEKRIEALCFTKAEELARQLSENGDSGFECLWWLSRRRSTTDNSNIVQEAIERRMPSNDTGNIVQQAIDRLAFLKGRKEVCYHAAKCAGHLPNSNYTHCYKPYADAMKKLLLSAPKDAIGEQKTNIDRLSWGDDRCMAWCYKAALASAWVAYAHRTKIRKSWATLKGGLWAEGDLPTWRSKGSLVGGPPIQKPGSTRFLVVKYKQHASPVCSGDYGRDGAGW